MNICKEIVEFLLDISRFFATYLFYNYCHSFWISIVFLLVLILLDAAYILRNVNIRIEDFAIFDSKKMSKKVYDKMSELYWALLPMRISIVLISVLFVESLKRGLL